MLIRKIAAPQWVKMLELTSDTNRNISLKNYLVIHQPEGAKKFGDYDINVITSDQLKDKKYQKLNLEEIAAFSHYILKSDKKITPTIEKNIAEKVERLIQAKTQRLHEARIQRGVLHILSYLLLATILFMPLGILIEIILNEPKVEIKMAKKFAAHTRKEIQAAEELRFTTYFKDVDHLIEELNSQTNYSKNENVFKDIIMAEKLDQDTMLDNFQIDQERLVFHVVVKEKEKIVYDVQRLTNEEMSMEDITKFTQDLFLKFKDLVGNNDNKKWLGLFQMVFTQQTQTCLVGNFVGSCFVINPSNTDNQDRYRLRDDIAPAKIQVTLVKNDSQKIEKLLVEATVSSAFFRKILGRNGNLSEDKQVDGKNVESTLHFEVSLNTQNEPEIKIIKYHHEML
jgi:hypothetical protein